MQIIRTLLILMALCPAPLLADSLKPLTALQDLDYQRFQSKTIDHDYHIYIKTPENPEKGTKYPTVYLLDGGITFPLLGAYSRYLQLAEDIPELIVVGVSYGTTDWQKGNRRSVDFTAPSKERDFWGGAEQFDQILENELLTYIENNYPADPERRIIFGQSLGGQFVLFEAMYKPGRFWGHIASNPALHRNLEFFQKIPVKSEQPVKLFISRARNDAEQYIKPMNQWVKYWQEKKLPINHKIQWLENHNHFSAAPEAFRNGLIWLFSTKNKDS